jgi:hypothetical protein
MISTKDCSSSTKSKCIGVISCSFYYMKNEFAISRYKINWLRKPFSIVTVNISVRYEFQTQSPLFIWLKNSFAVIIVGYRGPGPSGCCIFVRREKTPDKSLKSFSKGGGV